MNTIMPEHNGLFEQSEHTQTLFKDNRKIVLALGNSSHELSLSFSAEAYNCVGLNQLSELQDKLSTDQTFLPYFILIDYDWLQTEKESLASQILKFSQVSKIPIFGVAEFFDSSRKKDALRQGFSDVYTLEDDVQHISDRADFLQKYKPTKGQKNHASPLFQYHLPLQKRVFDILFSATALFLLSPLLLVIAFLIKIESPGPVLYVSKRVGSGFKVFDFYKFRTMRVGADRELKELMASNQYSGSKSSFVKINNDPRITSFGRFLRRTSLDEFPQLVNVLKGNMSIVGNRPLPLYEAEHLTDDVCAKRFLAPAGITGLWQVTKKERENMTDLERKYLDVTYAEGKGNWWEDIKIILKTFPALIQKDNF